VFSTQYLRRFGFQQQQETETETEIEMEMETDETPSVPSNNK